MPRHGRMTTERAKDFKGTLRQLLASMSKYKLSLVVVIVFAVLSTIFNIAGPKILAKATTALATGWIAKLRGVGGIDFAYIGKVLLFLLGMYLLSAAFSFIQGWLMSGLSQKVCYDFRDQISKKINRLPLAYFEKRTVGEVLSRITNDVDTLGQSLNQSVTQLITSVATMVGVLIMMLSISPKMTLIALLILPVSLALVLVVVKFSQKYFKAQQATLGVVNGQVEEVYSGHNVIKAFNREAAVLDDFNDANDKLYESAWKSQFLSGLMQPIMNFVGNLGYVAVAIVGSIFAAAGAITIGDIQAFIQYVKNFTQPIQQLAQVSNMLQSMTAAAERVFEFLNEPEEDQLADPARRADPACIDGQVTFDHVKFGYTPEKTVIHNFSCNVKPGQKVAIVGPTGAGKTTMVKLLMRFYDVDSGEILLNGHNVRDFDRSDLREGFGMVLQDTWLFKGTIMENIRYGRLDATDEEVIAAAKAANADHFIRTLPGGYQMELNEDASNVSQGQKQLLTIARTILADNRILILDEDGTGTLDLFLEVADLKWEAKDATTVTITAEDESHDLKLKDDKLVLEVDGDKLIFTKSDKDLSGTVKKDRENAEKEEEIDEAVEDDDVQKIEISPAVTVADDDLCTITITEKFKDEWGDIGFVVNITNKSDKDLTFYAPSGKTNVNGTMKDPWFSAHLMPGTNATEEFTFSNGELDSLDDLVNTTIGIDAYLTDSYEDVASYSATIA